MANDRARKTTALKDPMTKTQLLAELAENTGLSKKDVAAVLDGLSHLVSRHLKKRGAGQFTMPGLLKNQNREEAGDQSAQRDQSVHWRRSDVQGQTRAHHGQGATPQGP